FLKKEYSRKEKLEKNHPHYSLCTQDHEPIFIDFKVKTDLKVRSNTSIYSKDVDLLQKGTVFHGFCRGEFDVINDNITGYWVAVEGKGYAFSHYLEPIQ
ncbi:MAG: Unknown protein, partial [uncultured Thiotrichaceae bacterium]